MLENFDEGIPPKIINSKSFGKSKTYANLLIYLVECSKSGNIPKETTIASEIFGKDNFDPAESTLIRVYLFNLRKKIRDYYQNEGINDAIRLDIPKGSYQVHFVKKRSNEEAKSIRYSQLSWLLLSLLLVSAILNIWWWKRHESVQETFRVIPEESVWNDILHDNLPILVVLGDLFVYNEYNQELGLTRTIRDPIVNSTEEFERFKTLHPEMTEKTSELSYTFLIRNSSLWIKSLTKLFFADNKNFTIRVMSRFNPKELQDHNIVVVGMLKTFGLFNNYFNNSKFKFTPGTTIGYFDEDSQQMITYQSIGNADSYHTDYGVAAKIPGPNNNVIFMFGGLWDTAASQSLKNFTDPILLGQLEQQMKDELGKVPDYFEVLFEVAGIDRMELTTKILHLHEVSATPNVWNTKGE